MIMELKHINDILNELDESLREKLEKMSEILLQMESVVVGFSGGVDSTLLLKAARDLLGDRVCAIIAKSETFKETELAEAIELADLLDADFRIVKTHEMRREVFTENTSRKCYYCKKERFSNLKQFAEDEGYAFVTDGSNSDDLADYRPGMEASKELGIRSPLLEAGINKSEIIHISKLLGLPTWDKLPQPCLASRIPYGIPITKERLRMVGMAEEYLTGLGLRGFRVRYHNDLARIEAQRSDFSYLFKDDVSGKIASKFKEIGFLYIAIDIQGYRMGSLNEGL